MNVPTFLPMASITSAPMSGSKITTPARIVSKLCIGRGLPGGEVQVEWADLMWWHGGSGNKR
eukprot:scaffold33564_cov69-Phaeocystis_antarctica.AAC.7